MGVTVFGCIAVLIMIFTLAIKIFPVTCRRSVKKASRLGGFAGTDLFQILFLFPLLTMFIEYIMSNSGENAMQNRSFALIKPRKLPGRDSRCM